MGTSRTHRGSTSPRSARQPFALGLILTLGALAGLAPEATAQIVLEHFYVTNGEVRATATFDGILFIGGSFTQVGDQSGSPMVPRSHLAAFNITTGELMSWDPGANGTVMSLAFDPGDELLYVGGDFTSIAGQPRNRIAALDMNGTATSWNPNASNSVLAFAFGPGVVYASGFFQTIGGQSRFCLAALDAVTGLATSWNPNSNQNVQAMLLSGNTLYVGGDFWVIGGQTRYGIAALDVSTGLATAWNPGGFQGSAVLAFAKSGNTIYAAGWFSSLGGQGRYRIGAVDAVTGLATSFDPHMVQPGAYVGALAVSGNTVYAGGNFNFIGGAAREGIAALDADTGDATSWSADVDVDVFDARTVRTILVDGPTVFLGGLFNQVSGTPRSNFAAVGPDPVSIGDVTVTEDNAGTTTASFTVRVPKPISTPITVQYQTVNGTATIADGDFAFTTGVATIAAFETTGVATVPIAGDTKLESTETFAVSLSNASSNAAILDGTGQCTILNDDDLPLVSIGDAIVPEGNSGTRTAVFTLSMTNASDQVITMDFQTVDGSATAANNDYVPVAEQVTIPANATSGSVTVQVNGDLTYEPVEQFYVQISNAQGGDIDNSTGTCTITNALGIRDDLYVTNGQVSAATVSGNTLYIGGSFSLVGPATGSAVPFDASSGLPVTSFPKVVGSVQTIVADGFGGWYLGGSFTYVAGQARSNLAHLEPNLAVSTWAPNPSGPVNAIAVSGGTVYVGGAFSAIGGQSRSSIAAVDRTTGLATAWNPGANGTLLALATSGGTVYASGAFSTIGGASRSNIAAIDATTGLATAWNPGMMSSLVRALLVSGSTVYAGGDFSSIGGQTRNRIAALDAGTGLATAWNPSSSGPVMAMALSGTTLYVGGGFNAIGGQSRLGIAALSTATGGATSWSPNTGGGMSLVWTLAVSGATVYAGGTFQTIGGQSRNGLAALDATTGLATAWNPNPGGQVNALAINGTTVYAGGFFNMLDGQVRGGLAALDLDTGAPTSWNPGVVGNDVRSLLVAGPIVYVGGSFTSIGGASRRSLAALDASTGVATAWNPDVSHPAGPYVQALALSGSTVYLGGAFDHAGGALRNNLAAVDATTGISTSWNPNVSGGSVLALTVIGPAAYVGGTFSTVGGLTRRTIAAVDLVTGLPTAWNPDASGGGYVTSLAAGGAGLYVGGTYGDMGGQARSGIAELDLSTGLATAWNPGPPGSFVPVYAVANVGNTVYVGGAFGTMGGQARLGFAALDAASGLATDLDLALLGTGVLVDCIAAAPSIVVLGGGLTGAGGLPRGNLAGIGVEDPPLVSINDVTITEGDAGTTVANLTIGLSGLTAFPVTVHYQTQDGTATLANADYVAASGTATVDPKTLSVTLPIQINGDTKHETDETLTVTISSPTNATLGRATGQVTILNDDGTPSLSINDVTIAEGDTGSVNAVFTVKLSHPTDQPVSVLYQTYDGSATFADNDYIAASDTVFIDAKSDSATIAVMLAGDLTPEPHETFSVVLSGAVNAAIADSSGIGTIVNDDPDVTPPATPSPFTGVFTGGPVQLHWGANTEPDFAVYHLHRDTTEDFLPGPGNLVVSQADTGYVDAGSSWSYYKLSALDTTGNQSGFALLVPSAQASGATPSGSNVPVSLTTVQLTFQNVTGGGVTSLTTQTGGQAPPNGLKVAPGSPKLYYQLTTTASFTGTVTVCITYDPAHVSGQESNLKLMHYDTAAVPAGWTEVTTSVDVDSNRICGTVTHFSEFALMETDPTVDVREEIPATVQLYPCVPNPVSGTALIRFDLPVVARVRLGLFDLQGRRVRDLERATKGPGRYTVQWDGRGDHGERLQAGVYFLRLEAGTFRQVRRVALIN